MHKNALSTTGKEHYHLPGLTAWTHGIWGEEYNRDLVAVFWSGIFSCARESRKLFGKILPPDTPAIYVNHRGHGCLDDCSEGIISYDGILEDIRMVSEFVRELGFRKHLQVYRSVSCPPGFVDMIESSRNKLPMQDATIFISPPDKFYSYVPALLRLGNYISKNGWIQILSDIYNGSLNLYVSKKFEQMGDGITRIRYMPIDKDPYGILQGLSEFPNISEEFDVPGSLELEGESVMMVYGKEDETVPPEDMLNFAETLERCGADVTLVSMDSGHRVTSLKDANNLRLLDATVDLKSLAQLKGEVSWWLDGNSVLEPCGEQDLMDIEKNIDRCSELLETKPCGFGIKGYREGDGTLIYISR